MRIFRIVIIVLLVIAATLNLCTYQKTGNLEFLFIGIIQGALVAINAFMCVLIRKY